MSGRSEVPRITAALPVPVRFLGLLLLSVVFEAGLRAVRLPAAPLLGPMAAAILFAGLGAGIRLPRWLFASAQTIIGCMIAQALNGSILRDVLHDWPLLLASSAAVITASFGLGWGLAKTRVLPGSTAIWGASPGAATAMVIMSESFGADIRLVAFMQYLRVVCVAGAAALVARLSLGGTPLPPAPAWFPPLDVKMFAATLGVAAVGLASLRVRALPAGPLLVPILLGAVLADSGAMTITLPPWLLTGAYAIVGWTVGSRFDRAILQHALHALPRVLGSILFLVALCAGFGQLLTIWLHVNPLTAYLATSPGGADSVAIISATTPNVNIGFVMAMQMARFLVVMFTGPPLARWVARRFASPGIAKI